MKRDGLIPPFPSEVLARPLFYEPSIEVVTLQKTA